MLLQGLVKNKCSEIFCVLMMFAATALAQDDALGVRIFGENVEVILLENGIVIEG